MNYKYIIEKYIYKINLIDSQVLFFYLSLKLGITQTISMVTFDCLTIYHPKKKIIQGKEAFLT